MTKKVAILGSGAGSLAAAYGLTSKAGWEKEYEITVYNFGWRLGGKGTTGRNPDYGYRIEEHGLHMWFGFYTNAFSMIRKVYSELNRKPGQPLATWEEAFVPSDLYTMEQHFDGKWIPWTLYIPPNNLVPGDPGTPELWDYFVEAFRLLEYFLTETLQHDLNSTADASSTIKGGVKAHQDSPSKAKTTKVKPEHENGLLELLKDLESLVADALAAPIDLVGHIIAIATSEFLKHLPNPLRKWAFSLVADGIALVLEIVQKMIGPAVHSNLLLYRCWICLDLLGTMMIGMLRDNVFELGFDVLNDMNWQDWLLKNGLSEITKNSCVVQMGYDPGFSFYHGHRDLEAGTAMQGAIKMYLGYKGHVVYRFAAGCGDTVFVPLYLALKQRGVKFEFFHNVTELVCDDHMNISEMKMMRQAALKNGTYEPLIVVKDLPCWPAAPHYDQLVEGEELKKSGVDLESYWCPWKGTPVSLVRGKDFDEVICGISIAALPMITPTLQARSESWRQMLDKIETVQTTAFQFWFKESAQTMGWEGLEANVTCDGEPVDSWADLALTLPYEDWSKNPGIDPKCVAYFCGAVFADTDQIPPPSDVTYPARMKEKAKKKALSFIERKLERSFPNVYTKGTFDWDNLIDPQKRSDVHRLDAQYWRTNADPTERYVLTVVNSSKHRLYAGKSGFKNLFLAGDWTDNKVINAGCMEAAIISGLQASRAVCGFPVHIEGETGSITGG